MVALGISTGGKYMNALVELVNKYGEKRSRQNIPYPH